MFRIQLLIRIWNLIRKKPRGRKLPAYQVYIIYSFTTALFFTMVFTVNLVYQSEVIQLDPLQLVLVGTVLEAACFMFELPTGIVADLYSRKGSVLIGLVLTYLLTCCLKTVNNPIFNARLNSSIENNVRATVLSANGQMNALGQILGGPMIGILAERVSVSTGIFYTGILLIPVVLLYGFSANTLKSADKTVNKLLMDSQSDAGE